MIKIHTTKIQEATKKFVKDYKNKYGRKPTTNEVANRFRIKRGAAWSRLQAIKK